jgi:hypothetical protein
MIDLKFHLGIYFSIASRPIHEGVVECIISENVVLSD